MNSLVIGFCRCAKCGWTDNKFNWHTYFRCPVCGCKKYKKWGNPLEELGIKRGSDGNAGTCHDNSIGSSLSDF